VAEGGGPDPRRGAHRRLGRAGAAMPVKIGRRHEFDNRRRSARFTVVVRVTPEQGNLHTERPPILVI